MYFVTNAKIFSHSVTSNSCLLTAVTANKSTYTANTRTYVLFKFVVVVLILNCPFYPASSVHPVSVLISYTREILIMWSQTVRQRKTKYTIIANSCLASEMPEVYRVR